MEKLSNAKRASNKRRKARHVPLKYSGPSFSDLPKNVLEIILLRLSVKSILVCKYVCKTWYDVISDPEFAKLHFDQAEVYPLIHTSGFTVLSRMLYLVQPEQDDFELKLECNRFSPWHKRGCACTVRVKLSTTFRLPLRNLEMIVSEKNDEASRNNCLKLNMKDHKYNIVNSCNGFLCLCDPFENKPMVVCNPVTGEFVNLPEERAIKKFDSRNSACGFGFSPKTNQYKVIRIFTHCFRGCERGMVAEMHILGTESWVYLGYFPCPVEKLMWPTYLNGYLYWYCDDRQSVTCFDFEKDLFGSISTRFYSYSSGLSSLGVLGGELCLSESFSSGRIDVWVMKDCTGETYWTKMLSIYMRESDTCPWGSYQPIKCLNNGALLLYNAEKRAFLYRNPKYDLYRYFEVRGMQSKVEAFSHTPSFVSFKDAVPGMNTTVLNVRSRCGELKLHKEDKGISIFEQMKDPDSDCDSDCDCWHEYKERSDEKFYP